MYRAHKPGYDPETMRAVALAYRRSRLQRLELDSNQRCPPPNDFTAAGRLIGDLQEEPVGATEHVGRYEVCSVIGDVEENAKH